MRDNPLRKLALVSRKECNLTRRSFAKAILIRYTLSAATVIIFIKCIINKKDVQIEGVLAY